jgi:hypothetical protein
MCEFYDTSSYNDCREPSSDRIVEKDKANFCGFFKLTAGESVMNAKKETAVSAAEALFKK